MNLSSGDVYIMIALGAIERVLWWIFAASCVRAFLEACTTALYWKRGK